jgi:hypothetical protein
MHQHFEAPPMNEHHKEILFHLNHVQLTGLGCLAFLAIRENSTLERKWREQGFFDIPYETILSFELEDADLMELVTVIATRIFEDLTTNEKAIAQISC